MHYIVIVSYLVSQKFNLDNSKIYLPKHFFKITKSLNYIFSFNFSSNKSGNLMRIVSYSNNTLCCSLFVNASLFCLNNQVNVIIIMFLSPHMSSTFFVKISKYHFSLALSYSGIWPQYTLLQYYQFSTKPTKLALKAWDRINAQWSNPCTQAFSSWVWLPQLLVLQTHTTVHHSIGQEMLKETISGVTKYSHYRMKTPGYL